MAEKDMSSAHVERLERDREAAKLEQAQQRTHIRDDIPVQEALEAHLDEDPKTLKRVKLKVDLRLTLMLAVLYTCAFIDRSNLGNANIAGMGEDLGLDVGNRYSVVAMIVGFTFTHSFLQHCAD